MTCITILCYLSWSFLCCFFFSLFCLPLLPVSFLSFILSFLLFFFLSLLSFFLLLWQWTFSDVFDEVWYSHKAFHNGYGLLTIDGKNVAAGWAWSNVLFFFFFVFSLALRACRHPKTSIPGLWTAPGPGQRQLRYRALQHRHKRHHISGIHRPGDACRACHQFWLQRNPDDHGHDAGAGLRPAAARPAGPQRHATANWCHTRQQLPQVPGFQQKKKKKKKKKDREERKKEEGKEREKRVRGKTQRRKERRRRKGEGIENPEKTTVTKQNDTVETLWQWLQFLLLFFFLLLLISVLFSSSSSGFPRRQWERRGSWRPRRWMRWCKQASWWANRSPRSDSPTARCCLLWTWRRTAWPRCRSPPPREHHCTL